MRKINRALQIGRIAVSLAVFAALTVALTVPSLVLPVIARRLEQTQIIPTLATYTLTTLVVWLAVTLAFGRIYCSTVCPLGTLQDVGARAVRLRRPVRRYRYSPPRNGLRYTFMVVMLLCLMLQNVIAVAMLDPYSAYAEICARILAPVTGLPQLPTVMLAVPGTVYAAVLLVTLLVTSVRGGRVICNTVCPVGTTLGLVSRYSVLHFDIDTDRCTQCGRCADVCKASCIDLRDHVVDGSRCVTCFDCINVCPTGAIRYTPDRKRLSTPMMQAINNALTDKKVQLDTGAGPAVNSSDKSQSNNKR